MRCATTPRSGSIWLPGFIDEVNAGFEPIKQYPQRWRIVEGSIRNAPCAQPRRVTDVLCRYRSPSFAAAGWKPTCDRPPDYRRRAATPMPNMPKPT